MDTRTSPAYAAWIIGIGLLPGWRDNPYAVIPHDAKTKYLRALRFVTLTEESPSRSRAARAAGIPWGTVASWIHRDSEFREQVSKVFQQAEIELADLEEEPMQESDLEALERIQQLPEVELARIAVGEVPSRAFMAAAFPPGDDGGASADHPDWLWPFPAGYVLEERLPAGRVSQRPRALAVVPDVTPSGGNGQGEGPEEENEPPATPPPAAKDDGVLQPDPTANPNYYLPPSIRPGNDKPGRKGHGKKEEPMTDPIQDIESQLSALNVRLLDADGDERDALLDKEEELLARQRVYKAAPVSGDRQTVAREIKDAMNAAQQRVDALDAAPPASSQEGRLQHNLQREQAAATALELERRLLYAGHDDAGLQEALENAEIRTEELRDQVARHHPGDTRTKKAQREHQAGQLRVAEIQREVNLRAGLGAAAKLREKTNNGIADLESKAEWKRLGELKIAEAVLRVDAGEPSYLLQKAREEARALPPPEFLERKRREVAERDGS